MQRRDLVVKRLTALVKAAQAPSDCRFDECDVDRLATTLAGSGREIFDEIDESATVAVRISDQRFARLGADDKLGRTEAQRTIEQLAQFFGRKRLQHINGCARQQRAVDLERWILRRRTDERNQTLLDVRQKRVLLRLVEAVDLVDEQNRMPPRLGKRGSGARDRFADILDPCQHR